MMGLFKAQIKVEGGGGHYTKKKKHSSHGEIREVRDGFGKEKEMFREARLMLVWEGQ